MSVSTGHQAEAAAMDYLQQLGFKILEQNWRTRWCEIDIIAEKQKVIYFVEVKHRGNNLQGSGLDYITPRKQSQMQFAAEMWLGKNCNDNYDYRLSAIEVTGSEFVVSAWVDDIAG